MFLRTPTQSLSSLTLLHWTSKPLLLPKTLNCSSRLFTSSATSSTALESPPSHPPLPPHPWPEWVSFVNRLKSRGYFPPSSAAAANGSDDYREMNVLKDPCLSFARDRYDLFQLVSKDDIQRIVEVGCPKVIRKVVNSAKRLRVYLGLDEKNVCDACSLKGSCDRAYLIPDDSEGARTVDIMRVLLFYALDPTVISGVLRPAVIEQAESSARRLLSILIDLSEASKAPSPVEPSYKNEKSFGSASSLLSQDVKRREGDWVCPKCSFLNFAKNEQCRKCSKDVTLKQGDWICSKCSFLNFARNSQCKKCNEECPPERERAQVKSKKGDWICSECNFLNYARNVRCRKCDGDGVKDRIQESSQVELKAGDWNCPQCGYTNFARRTTCYRCTGARPPHALNQGEWVCTKCNFLNFRRNVTCLKCDSDHSNKSASEHDQTWRKPATLMVD